MGTQYQLKPRHVYKGKQNTNLPNEPPHGKTNNLVTAKLISAFVFATRLVQFLFYLNPKFQASSYFLCLYRPVYVGPVRKPHCWFSHEAAQIFSPKSSPRSWGLNNYLFLAPQDESLTCQSTSLVKKKGTSRQ